MSCVEINRVFPADGYARFRLTDAVTRQLSSAYDVLAPDGSEIRLVGASDGASLVQCVLPAGATSAAVRHRTVAETWLVIGGLGEFWSCDPEGAESVVALAPNAIVDLPTGTAFQFRSLGPGPLTVVIMTTPPWPGEHEAVPVEGDWIG